MTVDRRLRIILRFATFGFVVVTVTLLIIFGSSVIKLENPVSNQKRIHC